MIDVISDTMGLVEVFVYPVNEMAFICIIIIKLLSFASRFQVVIRICIYF